MEKSAHTTTVTVSQRGGKSAFAFGASWADVSNTTCWSSAGAGASVAQLLACQGRQVLVVDRDDFEGHRTLALRAPRGRGPTSSCWTSCLGARPGLPTRRYAPTSPPVGRPGAY